MDCKTARLLSAFAHPSGRELLGEEANFLNSHLSNCPECARSLNREAAFDKQVAKAMQAVPAPVGLRERILARLETAANDNGETSSPARRRFRPFVAAGLAAAAMLIVGWFLFRGVFLSKPAPDVNALVEDMRYAPASPDSAEKWFRDNHGIAVVAPTQFNYQYLIACTVVKHQKKETPVLVFSRSLEAGRRPDQAWVFIFTDREFNLEQLREEISGGSRGWQTKVLTGPNPHFTYLVLYTSERLEDFLEVGEGGGRITRL